MSTAEQTGQEKEKIKAFVSRHVRGSEWRNDEDMFELGLVNSLLAMQLVMFVERKSSASRSRTKTLRLTTSAA